MHWTIRGLAIASAIGLMAACASLETKPLNAYTAENTYAKYVQEYPFITIADTQVPSNIVERKYLTYKRLGNRELQLDLYYPKALEESGNTKAPAVVLVHGGGWRSGLGRDPMIEKLSNFGIPYRIETLPNTPHSFWLFDPWLEPSADIIKEFLDTHFHP